LAKTVII